jgi:hypothetical protein
VRYRGLKKNAHRLVVTCALANLFMARRHLLRCQGGVECPHCASTLHRQSNTPKDGAQSPTLSLADEISIPFLHAPAPCSDVP